MQLIKRDNQVYSSGIQNREHYSVAQTPELMRLLSDGLYSNKILAPIRELSTNAMDSHILAGKEDTPFELHIPTKEEPFFKLRDFGVGMSEDQINNLYTTYGSSTKSDSNEFNGCMGIGSKSPFAYTDSFTTISYYNGKKYVFINARDNKDLPTISKMGEFDTTEPNGLEISFNVDKKDISDFQKYAKSLFVYFPTLPKSNVELKTKKCEFIFEGEDWGVYKGKQEKYGWRNQYTKNVFEKSNAVMGWISYPIDIHHFDPKYAKLLDIGVQLSFDIGEVWMASNRESLQYNEFTKLAIIEKLDRIYEELETQVMQKMRDCKNAWEAACLMYELKSGDFFQISSLIPNMNLTFQDKQVKTTYTELPQYTKLTRFTRYNRKRPYDRSYATSISPNRDLNLFVKDIKVGSFVALEKKFKDDESFKNAILIEESDVDEFCRITDFDRNNFQYTSKLPRDKTGSRKNYAQVFELAKGKYHSDNKSNWIKAEVDVKSGGYYVPIYEYMGQDSKGRNLQSKSILTLKKYLDVPVYGIRKRSCKKFESSDIWHNFIDAACKKFLEFVNGAKDKLKLAMISDEWNPICSFLVRKKDLINGNTAKPYIDKLAKAKEYKDLLRETISDINNLKYYISDLPVITPEEHPLPGLVEKFPMLNLCGRGFSVSYITDFVDTKQEIIKYLNGESYG